MNIKEFFKLNSFKSFFTVFFGTSFLFLQFPIVAFLPFLFPKTLGPIIFSIMEIYFGLLIIPVGIIANLLGLLPKYCDGGFCLFSPGPLLILLIINLIYFYIISCLIYFFISIIRKKILKNKKNKKLFILITVPILLIFTIIIGLIYHLRSIERDIEIEKYRRERIERELLQKEKRKEDIANWQVYHNGEYGFEFKYPNNWVCLGKKNEHIMDDSDWVYHIELKPDDRDYNKNDVVRYPFHIRLLNKPDKVHNSFEDLFSQWGKEETKTDFNINNIIATKFTTKFIEFNPSGTTFTMDAWETIITKEHNNLGYYFEFSDYISALCTTDGDISTDFKEVISSFKFIEKENIIPYIKILSPSGGEEWEIGQPQTIRWETGKNMDNAYVNIFLDQQGRFSNGRLNEFRIPASQGKFILDKFQFVLYTEEGDGTCWNVFPENKYKIRLLYIWDVDSQSVKSIQEESDGYFSIIKKDEIVE
jgi:hypothetical protein